MQQHGAKTDSVKQCILVMLIDCELILQMRLLKQLHKYVK